MRMRNIKVTELLVEIKVNLVAFLSVVAFVCLGMGLYLGIRWAGVTFGDTADAVFEAGSLHDIEVQYPYGLTDDDLEELASVEGVSSVEPGYSGFVRMTDGSESNVLKVQSLTEHIDVVSVVEGELPQEADEIALLTFWADGHDVSVGDVVTLKHDAQSEGDEVDEDGMAFLTCNSFVVTALVDSPQYVSKVAGQLGAASVGSGAIDCVGFVTQDAFDLAAFDGAYPNVYLRCDRARNLGTYSDEYEATLQPVVDEVSALGEMLADARFHELYDRESERIDAAEQELTAKERLLPAPSEELEAAKQELVDAREQLAGMVAYEWFVSPRMEIGSVMSIDSILTMLRNVRGAMASLFVLVGLLVCYSAVSRLVYDHAEQIGTKKAMGFHDWEIAVEYLAFTGLAVVVGMLLACVTAVYVVELIMNPSAAGSYVMPDPPLIYDVGDLLVAGAFELVLILLSTWFAIHNLLSRDAVELLTGNYKVQVTAHRIERTDLWQRMSLYAQTIVNNCISAPRRVVATIVGVMGCTALIVASITLRSNVSRSIDRQYERVYDFETLVYLEDAGIETVKPVQDVLGRMGIESEPVRLTREQVSKEGGLRDGVKLVVPYDEETFGDFYHVTSVSGEEARLGDGGIWISAAFAEHMDVGLGDEVTLTGGDGESHSFTVAGVFEYYILHHEFVLGKEEYRRVYGEDPEPNVLLADTAGADLDEVRDALAQVEGYDMLVDDYATVHYGYEVLVSLLQAVVVIFLLLAVLMAFMVLLNLDLVFVEEKKRELVVLMINGFSVREAQAYIYRESLVLTAIGIVLGVVLGSVVGIETVRALEPSYGHFIKEFNGMAIAIGAIGAVVLSVGVLLYALRKIRRFSLVEINRF